MFENIILICSGLFALYSYYQAQEFKSKFQKEISANYEEDIFKIKRAHEFKISAIKNELHAANELIAKLRSGKEKAEATKENVIEKALANFI